MINILIVDDSKAMRLMVKKALRQAGFVGHDYLEAGDGVEALKVIEDECPDIVLSDWNMPNMNGMELLQAVTEKEIKVIFGFVTTEATGEMRAMATEAGAQFLITKPFTADSIQAGLEKFID